MGEQAYYICSCFLDAHRDAQEKIATFFGEGEDIDTVEEAWMVAESGVRVREASAFLSRMDSSLIQASESTQVGGIVLEDQRKFIIKLMKSGILSSKESDVLLEELQEDLNTMVHFRRATAKDKAKAYFVAECTYRKQKQKEDQQQELLAKERNSKWNKVRKFSTAVGFRRKSIGTIAKKALTK